MANRYQKLERPSRGTHIVPVEELARNSIYRCKVAAKFLVKGGSITNNRTVIGPDAAIIHTS